MVAVTAVRECLVRQVVNGQIDVVPWTVDQYHRMIEPGWLPEDTRRGAD